MKLIFKNNNNITPYYPSIAFALGPSVKWLPKPFFFFGGGGTFHKFFCNLIEFSMIKITQNSISLLS
jgi:hypothetical protein